MRFTVRSLGGKLIISAALTLLLCMLLFSTTSWLLLRFFYEHEARSGATTHLLAIKKNADHTQITAKPNYNNLAADLVRNTDSNVVLCKSGRIVGTAVHGIAALNYISEQALCTPGAINIIGGAEDYLTMSVLVKAQGQLKSSPSLLVVDIEPLYNIPVHVGKAILILLFLGTFIIALGVTAYALIARRFLIRPIRRLQARVAAVVADNADITLSASTIDELTMLARSFSLLSESLNMQENESNVITKRMSELLVMSDVLISTLNLEDLLGEIVSRLGQIMQVKNVALLLYGREMQSPWAVAQWSDQQQQLSNGHMPAGNSTQQHGAVTVHADPSGDIAMVVTSKMAAIPAPRSLPPSSGKRSAIRAPKLTSQMEQSGLHRPRIPRPALRDLDMILARMAMQKQKIAYGEDIQKIYQDRGEAWCRMALAAGYRSV